MKIGLCLSGGGIKGAAHVGVLKALEEENIKIDFISGTSSGSIVASMYAMGYTPDEIYQLFKKYAKEISKVSVTNVIKLIYGLIFKRKIIIEGLNTGNKLYKIVQEQAIKKGIKTEAVSLLDTKKIDVLYQEGYKQAKRHMKFIKQYLYGK